MIYQWDALNEFADRLTKVFVYIDEAHASDEWNIGLNGNCAKNNGIVCSIPQHKRDRERKDAALMLVQKSPSWFNEKYLIAFATIESRISEKFNAWPFGIWLLDGCNKVKDLIHPCDSDGTLFDIAEFAHLLTHHQCCD